ncbi:hypothetical protein DQ238_00665 [Geodermatophilus sp. TF02-6]|uniref:MFS transporter n=1 Tax=Geodermatophilus sp. TF02-6 TaxID=2250575 RepID=UPI000DEA5AE5|nr:MFS transporter [Geodermatophilus sp. TF02-6]RBY83637.1 hypothetical protein DQ238_00665 [Geodermatophilus sp. TF02-6]
MATTSAPPARELCCPDTLPVRSAAAGCVVGKLSDRTTSRLGMRKPWMIAGVVLAVVGLAVMASSTTVALILLGWCVATIGLNATIAALVSLLPDQVPHSQRGRVSGILGMGLPVGAVGGALLAQAFTTRPLLMFLAPAVVLVVGVGLLLPSCPDRRLGREEARQLPAFGPREFLGSYWVSPRRHRTSGGPGSPGSSSSWASPPW